MSRKIRKILIIIIAQVMILGQINPVLAANNTFNQTDWIGGISSDTAVHPTNQSGWNKYSSQDFYITTASAGKVSQSVEALSVTDTTDSDFTKTGSQRNKIDVSGTGTGASLVLQSTLEDPFTTNLSQWTSLPEAPYLTWWSAFVRVVHPVDGKVYIYALWNNRTFARFSAENESWEILKDTPSCFGFGAALAYPSGGGDYIYALRGAGTKDFWRYSISTDTWTKMTKSVNYNVGAGGSLAAYGSNSIYCVVGNNTRKFLVYSISGDTWTELADVNNTTVDRQGSLIYPGSGEYLYLINRGTDVYTTRYKITVPTGWTSLANASSSLGDACYPGTGDYIYAWNADDWNRRTFRLNITSATPAWEDISATARIPMYPYRSIMYYPGSGTKLKWLNAGSYTRAFSFDPTGPKWDDLVSPVLYNFGNGSDMVYDGSNYIYAVRGDDTSTICRYSISGNSTELRNSLSFNIYYGGSIAYLNGYIYYTRGAGSTSFGRYDTSLNSSVSLTATPDTVGYGGGLCAVGNYIYALRGNSSNKFWRYDPSGAGGVYWDDSVVADAPDTVGEGGAMVYPGSEPQGDFIYVVRGGNTKTFWRYCISSGPYDPDTWYVLADAPFKVANRGRLLYPGNGNYIYLMTGTREQFARYQFKGGGSGVWEILEPTPFYQSYYYGACAIGDTIYANYQTDRAMYTYTISTGVWSRRYLDTYSPYYGSIVYPGGDIVYMFYGNYTSHFWKYSLSQKKWVGLLRAKAPSGSSPIVFGPGTKACYPGSNGQAGSENYIYVIEGRNSRRFWRYDYVNDTWTQMSSPQQSGAYIRFYSGSQLDGSGDTLFACQGRDITNLTEERSYKFLKYTVSTDTWQVSDVTGDLPNLPNYIRDAYEMGNKLIYIPSQNRVYWVGFEDGTLRYYDTSSHTWSSVTAPTYTIRLRNGSCLYYHSADNSIFWISGQDYRKTYNYSIGSNTWTELSPHGRCWYYSGYDADMFYPGSGDLLYLTDGQWTYLNRYSISKNDWDLPSTLTTWQTINNYTVFCAGADGNSLYIGGYEVFYKYDLTSRVWTTLLSPYNTAGLNWRWDEWNPQLVYYAGDRDSLFTTRGRNRTQFAKYSISQNTWTDCLSPGTFGNGHCLVATQYKVYALLGGSTTTFKSYNPAIPQAGWADERAFPDTVNAGAAMVYIPSEDAIYATRGNSTASFYKFTISNPQWIQLEDAPVSLRGDPGGSSMVYPGSGDYIYLVAGPIYGYWGETCSIYRFSLSQQKWDTTDLQSTPEGIRGIGKIVYPGKGDYMYVLRGYGAYDILKYLLFKQGTYTSEVKNIGRNKNYGVVTWTDTGDGAFEFKGRTADNSSMSGATDWDNVPLRRKGDLLSDSYPVVQNRHQYFQYQMKFFADDLNKLPTLNDLTINYSKYRTKQEIVSSPYDSTEGYNRLMKLNWMETLPTGTDIRLQLRTGATKDALLDANNHFLGPGGTQTFNYDFSTDGDYAHASTVEVTGGVANLKKLLQDYQYTQRIVLDNSAGTVSYTNSAVKITITSSNNHFWNNVKSDGGDIRFVDQQGNNLSYNCTAGMGTWDYANKTANILVKVPSIPAGSKTSIYLKYGKSDAVSASDPTVTGRKIASMGGYCSGDSGDYGGLKGVGLYIGVTWDDTVSGYSGNWIPALLNKDLIMIDGGRPASDVTTTANNGAIVVTDPGTYNTCKSILGITQDINYTSRGYTTYYFAYGKGYIINGGDSPLGCTWEHWGAATMQARGLNFRDTIISFPNAGVDGSDIYLDLTIVPVYFSLYEDKTTSPSLSGWEYRHEIEIDNTQGAQLANYQIKVTLSKDHEDFWSRCMSNGYDVRFIDSDNTTILNYYRVSFDYANKAAEFWVKVPLIAAGEVKRIYLYYSKSDAADVSSYNNTFTKEFGEKGYNTSAVILDGADDKITVNHSSSLNISGNLTLEANVKYTADTWFPGFGYRKKITLDNTGGSAKTNTAVQIDVSYVDGKMNADYSDIRFVDTDGTKLRYRIKSYDALKATVYVMLPSIPGGTTKDIYVYYGNPLAASESDSTMIAMPGSGLVGWWSFNEGTGSTVYDLSGNGNNGSLQNGAYFSADGKNGGGLGLDGINDQVYISNSASLQVSGSMTICFWLKPTTVGSGRRNPIHKEYAREFSFTMESGGASGISYYHGWGGSYYGTTGFSSSSIVNGTWTHYAFVRNNTTRTWNSYKNGVADLTSTWPVGQDPTAGTSAVLIGAGYAGYVGGVMDDVVIYNRTLTVEEIQQTFNANTTFIILAATFDSEETQPAINQTVLSKSGAYELRITQSGLVGYLNGSAVVSTVGYDTGRFMHAAFSYDGINAKLYVNGAEKASVPASGAVTTNTNNVIIGDLIKGAIDEVRIWNIARKPGSINEDKEKYLDGTETGLKCYLRLNENSGTSAADATANGNNGAISGSASWLAPSFTYSNGRPSVLYHMDEGTGETTADSSGNNLTLNLSPDISWSSTDLTGFSTGKSLNMNVANVVATVADPGDNSVLDVTGKISLEAWIQPDTNAGNRVILVKGDDTQLRWNYKLYQSNDSITFSFYSGGAERVGSTTPFIIAGTLYHIVATFNEDTDVVKIYVNGVEKYSGLLTYNMVVNNDTLRIGKDVSAASLSYRGLIDDVRIYRRVMTPEEIKRHYEHRLLTLTDPGIYNVYAPPTVPEIGSYADNNPTIQPVMGVFYTNKNVMQFQEIANKPVNTDIRYQISKDGYWWYWFNASQWVPVDGGYSQANSASVVNANLGAFQNMTGFEEGDFYYRAFLHSEPSSYRTPSLDNIAVTLYNTETYYLDPTGATPINPLHTDADNDRWFQYKAILYSDGETTPILDDVSIEYINAYLHVLSPNGGETLSAGLNTNLTWESHDITSTNGYVKIEYSVDGAPYTTVAEHVPNTGSYTWKVADTPSENVLLKISSEDFPVVYDTSDAPFSILSLTVDSPNGGEIWEQTKSHNITWTATGEIPFNVLKIDYSSNNGSTWNTISASVPNTGSYPWVIPQISSDQVLVKIYSTYNGAIRDTSNAVFSIVPPPAFSISSPAGGETWIVGEKHNISWRTNALLFADEVILEYSTDDFVSDVHQIAQVSVGTPQGENNNDDIVGTYEWTVADAVSGTVKVRVREASVPAGRDTQVAVSKTSVAFIIAEPTITLTAPESGDIFVVGDTHNITWTSVGAISNNLLLEYSTDGQNYTQIATGEANDGTYSWVIPAGAAGDNVYVRITDTQRTQVNDVSEAFKVFEHPEIEIIQPDGGEELNIGTTYPIKWRSYGQKLEPGGSDYNKVSIYYSTNNGTSWTVVSYQSANTGTYNWLVPDEESNQCLIKIIDENDTRAVDISASVFSIVLPTVTIISPDGGEVWYATGKYNITWSSVGAVSNNLRLEYSTNNGSSWNTIASGLANSGIYQWSPIADVSTAQALIRITDLSRPVITDVSNGVFTITPPTITVTSPNGAEEFAVGTTQEITWESVGKDYEAIRDDLTIQYSTNGGGSWIDVDIHQQNDGAYTWIVPDTLSNTCKVKIFDASRPATSDISDANFKIVLPYIRITSPNGNEQWPIGTKKNITWICVGTVSNDLKIEYSKDNFSSAILIEDHVQNTGTYEWTIPNDYSTNVKVRITDNERTEIFDVSDAAFVIAYPIITITAPNNAELWTVGDTENITWQNTGSVGNSLKIEYSKDNFISDLHEIAAAAPNTGTYAWEIPNDVSSTVRVRITDNTRSVVWDKSDVSFTILPRPVITISAPNGGELWRVGTQHNITWTDNGGRISNNLTIQYSTNGGTSWKPIASSVSNSGQYAWTVPDDVSATCLVKIFDANRPVTEDVSDEVFRIEDPLITITSPNGGETWAVGDSAPVTWTSEGTVSNNLILEWSPNGGGDYYAVRSGVANTGSFTWTVPGDFPSTSNAIFRITDGNRPAVSDVSNQTFTIIPIPTITITNPTGGQEFVLGDAVDITWTCKGLSISNNLLIEISNDNFVSSRQIIAQGVANTGTYNWILTGSTLTGATLKIRITDGSRTEIKALSNGYFRIRGGFTVLSPNGGEYWVAKSSQTVTWQTRGSVARIKLEYSTDGTNWNVITAAATNNDSYSWVLPDVKSSTVKVRISDPDDPTTKDESDSAFNIVYATAMFKVLDYDTLQHLQDFSANEPATGWSDSGLSSPITRTEVYHYGTYTTFFSKANYIDNSVTWNPPKSGTTPYVVTVYLENSASAQVTWESIFTYSYSPGDDTLNGVGSLQRKGKLVGTTEYERQDMGPAILTIYEPGGATVRKALTCAVPNTTGMYTFTYAGTGFQVGKVYPATLSIEYRGRPYISSANIDVGSEKLQYEFFTKTAAELSSSVIKIEKAVGAGTAQIQKDLSAAKDEIKTETGKILTATGTSSLPEQISETQGMIETSMKSEILNRENTVRSGQSLTIRYRTYTGLSPTIDVYDALNVQRIAKGKMTEIGSTGIYEYDVNFSSAWGKGEFTIVCSESTKGTLDALIISALRTDIEQISGDIAGILGTTSGITGLKAIADSLNSQFSIIETALAKVGKDLVTQVKDATASTATLESVHSQLSNVAQQIEGIVGTTGVNLEKLYQVTEEKKDDIVYLKNKTQQLKAAMEVNQKMIDNIANKPVTQTWYEYR